MNIKMNKFLAVIQPMVDGMTVDVLGDDYYMSDSVLYRKNIDGHGVYVNMSMNTFISKCWLLSATEIETITSNYIKWKSKNDIVYD